MPVYKVQCSVCKYIEEIVLRDSREIKKMDALITGCMDWKKDKKGNYVCPDCEV